MCATTVGCCSTVMAMPFSPASAAVAQSQELLRIASTVILPTVEEYTYYDDPNRKRKPAERSHLVEFSVDYWKQRKQQLGPKAKSYPWDVVKRVSGIYGDVHQQL